jgi:hypothetical protein
MATKTTTKPAAKGTSARQAADKVSAAIGRTVTPKTIRQWFRDHLTRFQDESYTVHRYSAAEVQKVMKAFQASDARRTASKAGDQPADDAADEA